MHVNLKAIFFCVLILAPLTSAHAATVSLQPQSPTVTAQTQFSIDIVIDFSDTPTAGGGVDIFWDSSALAFDEISFSTATVFGDPGFQGPGVLSDGSLIDVFHGDIAQLETVGIWATLTFTALQSGVTEIGITEATDPLLRWSDFNDFFSPDFFGATLDVQPVPVPAAVWLFGSALLALRGISKKTTTGCRLS